MPPSAAEPATSSAGVRALRAAAVGAAVAHVAASAYFAHLGRFFSCEDDAYRTYLAFLVAHGEEIIGRFWLPGHIVAMAMAQRLGVPAAWSGIAVGSLSVVALAAAVAAVARAIAPSDQHYSESAARTSCDLRAAAPWAALLLVASSPMTLVVGHSSLAEPLECALVMGGAAALIHRARGGPRWVLAPFAIAILAATWVRYESWPVAVTLPGVLYLLRRRAGDPPRVALIDAAIGLVPLLGPAAWMWQQAVRYNDALAFLDHVSEMSREMTGDPSSLLVLSHRASALARWAPATLAWAATAIYALRDRREARAAALSLAGIASLGVISAIVLGREHVVFVQRLAYEVEVALWPLAALGIAWAVTRKPTPAIAGAIATIAVLSVGVRHDPEILDEASVTAGLMLRRGGLEAKLGSGLLLVERETRRPPFGWAALGVQWGRWDRTVWGTRRVDRWDVVAPTDVRGKTTLQPEDLKAWLETRNVTAAWILTPRATADLSAVWPAAKVMPIGEGTLVIKE